MTSTRIFLFEDYREFLRSWLGALPRGGRGELRRLAAAAGVHASTLSLVMRGQRELTEEQALAVGEHLGLVDSALDFFILLVRFVRAGTPKLRAMLRSQIEQTRTAQAQLSRRLPVRKVLSDEERAIFYSNWYYSAARIVSSIPGCDSIEAIARKLSLPEALVSNVMDFLVRYRLCVEKEGRLRMGPQSTHLEARSPLVSRHHSNWRVKAMERHPQLSLTGELAYTGPMSLSRRDAERVRAKLVSIVEEIREVVDDSPAEAAYCLNLDWFEIE